MAFLDTLRMMIAEEVSRTRVTDRRLATVVERDSTNLGQHQVTVVFDGDAIAVPVAVFSNVRVRPGDRVGVLRWAGTDWTIVGTYGKALSGSTAHFPVWGWSTRSIVGGDSTTLSTYSVLGTEKQYFAKEHDWTYVDVDLRVSCYVTTVPSPLRLGARFTDRSTGTVTDQDMIDYEHNAANDRQHLTARNHQVSVPAGEYDIEIIWKRLSGTGAVTAADQDDQYCLLMQETPVAYYRG